MGAIRRGGIPSFRPFQFNRIRQWIPYDKSAEKWGRKLDRRDDTVIGLYVILPKKCDISGKVGGIRLQFEIVITGMAPLDCRCLAGIVKMVHPPLP